MAFSREQQYWLNEINGEPKNARKVPKEYFTEEFCLAMVRQESKAIRYLPEEFKNETFYIAAMQENGYALEHLPKELKTEAVCRAAVQKNGLALEFVPDALKTKIVRRVEKEYKIGDTGPAGGIVFYDKENDGDGWRYLEAAPAETEFVAEWGDTNFDSSSIGNSVGCGKRNTRLIIEASRLTGIAADLCAGLNINGYNDWFMPSNDELNLMYKNLRQKGLGGFKNTRYYSSSLSVFSKYGRSTVYASSTWFGDSGQSSGELPYYVRAIRAF